MAVKRAFHLILSLLTFCGASTAASAQAFTQSAEGKALFDGLCEGCHGVNGTGDEGPALNRPNLTLASDDAALRRIIRDGIPDKGMPRVRRMTDDEVVALASYVRSLGRAAPVTVAGNADRGRAVYQRLDCAACHVVAGQGGVLGPELTKIGERRAPNYLRQAVLEPGSVLSKGVLGILVNGFTEYLPVSVIEKNGREVRGIRVNEDSFTIQMRDADGKFYSFRKGDVEHVDKQFGRSLMPSYKDKLNPAQTDDLVAYLYSLGGRK
jgi:putative heme-binding domain-containing protein